MFRASALVAAGALLVAACSSDATIEDAAATTAVATDATNDSLDAPPPDSTTPPTPLSTTTTSTTAVVATTAATSTASIVTIAPPASTTPDTTTSTPLTTAPETTAPVTTTPAPSTDRGSIRDVRPASDLAAPPLPDGWLTQSLGTSVQGRAINALVRPVDTPTRGILVVGGIHGNEPASPPTVRAFVEATFGADVAVWLVPEMNPDGVAAGTRWNANGVDLNRNFPWDWRSSDGGPAPLSEPESRAISDFITAIRPGVVVWVHQPYGYVSSVGGTTRTFESAWSAGSGLPTRSGVTQHGGGESWTHFDAGLPSMLIEIDTWAATPEIVAAQLAGFRSLLAELGWDS